MPGIERESWATMASSPAPSGVPGSAMPFQRSAGATSALGASGADRSPHPASERHIVLSCVRCTTLGARDVGRPFASGALSEDAAQAQEDKDRQREEDV